MQLPAFRISLYSPDAHAVHTRLLVALPAALTYVPAAQSLHVAQLVAFVPAL